MKIQDYFAARAFSKNCTKMDNKRDAGLTIADDVEVFKDFQYGDDPKSNVLDLYKPKGAEGKLPVFVSVHGGGYVYGDKERYAYYTSYFVKGGFAVVNFTYTLAPKKIFPTPIVETNMVMEWICNNAEKYGLDTDNVVMIGDSAGAQIASQYAVCATNPKYAEIMGITVPGIKLKALSLGCGVYSLVKLNLSLNPIKKAYLTRNPEQFGEQIKVLDYVTEDYPPTFLISSPGDFLLENLEPMEKLLQSKGVETKSKVYGDKETYHVFFCDMRSKIGEECNKEQIEWLKSHVG